MLAMLAPIAFKCMTGFPTTTFTVRTEGNEVVVETLHHNGVKYMPIHRGIVVPSDIPYLEAKTKVLGKMGARNEFRFPLDKCKIYGKGLMSCAQGNSQVFDGTRMTATYFNTSTSTDRTMEFSFDKTTVTLSVNIEGFVPVQEISMDYWDGECDFGP